MGGQSSQLGPMLFFALNEYNLPYPPPLSGPIHPIVVHFVIATVVFSVLCDSIAYFTQQRSLANVAWWNLLVASVAIIIAIFFGQVEAGLANPTAAGGEQVLGQHMTLGWILPVLLLGLALWRALLRNKLGNVSTDFPRQVSMPYLGAGFALVGLVFYQTFLGTMLVWSYGVHIRPVVEATRTGDVTTGSQP
ncbi:DUF2231 domain-containing protein [Candidatus Cyanaurora vandensis]|uniref:DUF2231 domain-containing protein n=1 Tax=Candidatus Cyanaurora vandensis TaxID=2714958 RepID=UPI00257B8D29|nr:DUF2231 domain-containing protein [Candidatus Cyanaurora vandensis]